MKSIRNFSRTQRDAVFIFGCLGTRALLAYLAYKNRMNKNVSNILSIFTLIVGVSFAYLYITDSRRDADEAGGKVWWTGMRPIHALLYLLFAYSVLIGKSENAYVYLIADVVIAALAFAIYRKMI